MAAFQLAFGCYTGARTLIGKAAIDVGACLWHDPLRHPVRETVGSLAWTGADRIVWRWINKGVRL